MSSSEDDASLAWYDDLIQEKRLTADPKIREFMVSMSKPEEQDEKLIKICEMAVTQMIDTSKELKFDDYLEKYQELLFTEGVLERERFNDGFSSGHTTPEATTVRDDSTRTSQDSSSQQGNESQRSGGNIKRSKSMDLKERQQSLDRSRRYSTGDALHHSSALIHSTNSSVDDIETRNSQATTVDLSKRPEDYEGSGSRLTSSNVTEHNSLGTYSINSQGKFTKDEIIDAMNAAIFSMSTKVDDNYVEKMAELIEKRNTFKQASDKESGDVLLKSFTQVASKHRKNSSGATKSMNVFCKSLGLQPKTSQEKYHPINDLNVVYKSFAQTIKLMKKYLVFSIKEQSAKNNILEYIKNTDTDTDTDTDTETARGKAKKSFSDLLPTKKPTFFEDKNISAQFEEEQQKINSDLSNGNTIEI